MARAIMFQGTSSHVGKSILTAALCRILAQDGYKVTPFKAQNMALNSFVTKSGGEMGRAQVVQAHAAFLEPEVIMNPILLKPTRDQASQVIVLGKPVGNFSARDYHQDFKEKALEAITFSLSELYQRFEILVIEGAGSPAEVNLKDNDIVNMKIAKLTQAPVLLVADIDRGGALASIVGTLELLEPEERELVKGIIINKFRGDLTLLKPALTFLEQKTGKPVLGVIPYFKDFMIPEEDSVATEGITPAKGTGPLFIAVIALPHLSNFTDFDALALEPDVTLTYVKLNMDLGDPDLIILPGTKNTIEDMLALEASGLATKIKKAAEKGTPVIGICGGFQMLGQEILDPLHTEANIPQTRGLGLLDAYTTFEPAKITTQVTAFPVGFPALEGKVQDLTGYEIHMGRTVLGPRAKPAFILKTRCETPVNLPDGAVREDGLVWGTYMHGIFDNDDFRRFLINQLRQKKGLSPLFSNRAGAREQYEEGLNRLAETVRANLNMAKIYELLGV